MSAAEKIPWELRAIGAEEVGELLGLAPRTGAILARAGL